MFSIGEASDNERLSVLEDWVRLSEGVDIADATLFSSTGGNTWCLSPCPNMPLSPHLLLFLPKPRPSLSFELLAVDEVCTADIGTPCSCPDIGLDGSSGAIGDVSV